MGYQGDDIGSIVGGLLSGFSGTYFPMKDRREARDLARERMLQDQEDRAALMALRREEADWRNMERAEKLRAAAAEDAWMRGLTGGGQDAAPAAVPGGDGFDIMSAVPGGQITSPFGPRTPPMPGASANHLGVDIAAPAWTPVKAPVGGNFSYGQDPKLGNFVGIDDGSGQRVTLGHLMDFAGVDRTQVNPGDVIGYVGQSGVATGPHVHAVVRQNGQPVDPLSRRTGPAGAQYAQAGGNVMSDASGAPQSPIQRIMAMSPEQFAAFVATAPPGARDKVAQLTQLYKLAREGSESDGLTGEAKNFEIMMGRKPTVEEYINLKRQGSPSTVVNVGEKKFSEKLAEKWADDYATMFNDAKLAQGVVDNIEAAQAVMDSGLQTGALEPAKAQLSRVAQSLGIDPGKLGLQDAGTPQAFQAIAMKNLLAELVMQKGPQTEGDAQRAMQTFMSLGNTPQANRFIMDYARQLAQRKIDMANYVYNVGREKYDGDSYRAMQDWQEHIKDKPLQFNTEVLSTSPAQQSAPQAPPEGAIVRDKTTGKLLKIVNGQPVPLE